LLGLTEPVEGDEVGLTGGARGFGALAGQLNSAKPDTRWEGRESVDYAIAVSNLEKAASHPSQDDPGLAELDTQLAGLVNDAARCVAIARFAFGLLELLLSAAAATDFFSTQESIKAGFNPWRPGGWKFEITVSLLGIAAFIAILTWVAVES